MTSKQLFIHLISITALSSTVAIAQQETDVPMTFFVTSTTHSGNLGGLAGADAICQQLATAAGAGDLILHHYIDDLEGTL